MDLSSEVGGLTASDITGDRFRLRTRRLALRELMAEDVSDFARIGGHADVAPMLMAATVPWPEAAVARWIEMSTWRGSLGFRAAVLRDGAVIGCVGAGQMHEATSSATLMYFIDPAFWGKGYAYEAVGGFIEALFQRFPELAAFHADHFTDNPASGAVLRKLGFEETGTAMGESAARLEPAPVIEYRMTRSHWKNAT